MSCKSLTLDEKLAKEKFTFFITVGSYFENDKVSIIINDKMLYKDLIVNSNKRIGIAGVYLEYYKTETDQKIILTTSEGVRNMDFVKLEKQFFLKIKRNGFDNDFYVDLRKGKYISIEGCDNYGYTVRLNHYKKTIILD